VNLATGEQNSDEYRAINPQGFVPMLEIDGHRLTQSVAIITYLDARYPNQPLLPASAAKRAHVASLGMTIACDIHPLNNLRVLNYLKNELGHSQERLTPGTGTGSAKGSPRWKRWPRRAPANSGWR
jgi:maleylacetoacetate isomerase